MKINNYTLAFLIRAVIGLWIAPLFSQHTNDLFVQLKEKENQKVFYSTLFRNPSLMTDFGKYAFSELEIRYENSKKDAYLIQKPEGESTLGVAATSFVPMEKQQAVWGKASYHNQRQYKVRWNESLDYPIVYPYFTADSVGGDLHQETYAFTGGYAKAFRQCNIGVTMDYRAQLASRNKDPRPKNISSDLNLQIGTHWRGIPKVNVGAYLGFQKYTQANDIKFFNELGSPPVYHLNAMGYYNNLLKGTKLRSFYEGYGYSAGAQLVSANNKNTLLTADYTELIIEKLTLETNGTQVMRLTNRNLNINLVKLFKTARNLYGIRLNYENNTKIGSEPILSGRENNNTILEIATNQNYQFVKHRYELSGLFFSQQKGQIRCMPFVNYQLYREDYSLIRSFQHFDYLNFGADLKYIAPIDVKNVMQIGFNLHRNITLYQNSLLRNDNEISLSEMMASNNAFLASNFTKYKISLRWDKHIRARLGIFCGVDSEIASFDKKTNSWYAVSAGISF